MYMYLCVHICVCKCQCVCNFEFLTTFKALIFFRGKQQGSIISHKELCTQTGSTN